ncbi:MAG TPA: hypothetical protein VGH34_20675 [Vicinamibacterales bacterium]|jgi:hypothetical protein
MSRHRNHLLSWLTVVVVVHLVLAIVHGTAHTGAQVRLPDLATTFVVVVILAGPLVGIGLTVVNRTAGGWVVAGVMTASFVFGAVNHFMLHEGDHISQVPGPWGPLFASTALLLAGTELLGAVLAINLVRERSLS